jgi:hypothetical protein
MTDELEKNSEGSGGGLIEVPARHLSGGGGGALGNPPIPQLGLPVWIEIRAQHVWNIKH